MTNGSEGKEMQWWDTRCLALVLRQRRDFLSTESCESAGRKSGMTDDIVVTPVKVGRGSNKADAYVTLRLAVHQVPK